MEGGGGVVAMANPGGPLPSPALRLTPNIVVKGNRGRFLGDNLSLATPTSSPSPLLLY